MPEPLEYARPLRRQIGLFGATMLGLGSILGTGVFVGIPQATALAGPWVLVAIVLAGLLAFCNAMSSAQLAAAYPVAGGTYEYGYRLLSPAWGFTAGWTFLLAKSASAATAALAIADVIYHLRIVDSRELGGILIRGGDPDGDFLFFSPAQMLGAMAVTIAALITIACLVGMRRTNALNIVTVSITAIGLVYFVTASASSSFRIWHDDPADTMPIYRTVVSTGRGLAGLAEAIVLCFVAFTGYGRLATLGEEVHDPSRTIPRAISVTLLTSVVLYVGIGFVVAARFLFPVDLDVDHATLTTIASALAGSRVASVVSFAALTAMLGVLLNLILGLSRVWLAMGRRGDMPRVLARVSERSATPVPATILSGLVIAAFVLVGDVRLTWSFSAFSVLIYYAITNFACLRLPAEHRRYPRALAWAGLVACLSLAWFVEVKVWAVGVGLIAAGLVWHRMRRSFRADILVPSPGTPGEG